MSRRADQAAAAQRIGGGAASGVGPRAASRRVPWPAVPLGAYLTLTLGLPMLNGAAASPGFWRHALWVLGGCAAVWGGIWALGRTRECLVRGMRWIRVAVREAWLRREAGVRSSHSGSGGWR